jgi:hypothetical protein
MAVRAAALLKGIERMNDPEISARKATHAAKRSWVLQTSRAN